MRDLIALLVDHGVLIVFAATLAARIGAPVPASPLLVVAGGLAAAGEFSWFAALGSSIVANIVGDGHIPLESGIGLQPGPNTTRDIAGDHV